MAARASASIPCSCRNSISATSSVRSAQPSGTAIGLDLLGRTSLASTGAGASSFGPEDDGGTTVAPGLGRGGSFVSALVLAGSPGGAVVERPARGSGGSLVRGFAPPGGGGGARRLDDGGGFESTTTSWASTSIRERGTVTSSSFCGGWVRDAPGPVGSSRGRAGAGAASADASSVRNG